MSEPRSRSQQQIFLDLYRELRRFNPETPESPERLDPILRLLLQVNAHQLERIDKRLDVTWDVATSSLIKSVCPDSGRWPVPAHTVMQCDPTDPVVEVDRHTRFYYKEKREGGQSFFFAPHSNTKILAAKVVKLYLRNEEKIFDLSPKEDTKKEPPPKRSIPPDSQKQWQLFVAVDYAGQQSGLNDAVVFLRAETEQLNQFRWAYWYPGSHYGTFHEDSGFCPGLSCTIEDILGSDKNGAGWGGLRSNADMFIELEKNFAVLPTGFTSMWEPGPIEPELARLCKTQTVEIPPEGEHYYWMRIDLPTSGKKQEFEKPFGIYFNSLVATNKNELTLFKHTGGNQILEIEIPDDIHTVLEVVAVVDSGGNEYRALHEFSPDTEQRIYSIEERNDHLVLWFDFGSIIEGPPDSITVTYAVTAGVSANNIEAGKINNLYENHPGINAVTNITPTKGAIPAKTQELILTEASLRLRQRDRAMTFDDISAWTRIFDPRIQQVACRNGVQRSEHGVRRCIVLTISVDKEEFYSGDEVSLLQKRLSSFLKARSPVNAQFEVEIVRT